MVIHHIGVIGGSGLYDMQGLTDVREQLVRTPFGEPSAPIIMGTYGETRFYFLPRHGKAHDIPPHRVNYRANVYALKLMGARQLVSVSAVGSLREHIHPGDVVLVDQFLDHSHGRVATFFDDEGLVAHVGLADPTDAALSQCLADAAEASGAQIHRAGTYVCVQGPQFSTRAESRRHRALGGDVVGMTNMPEARLAREAELPYASCCLVTDYDCWHEREAPVSVEGLLEVLRRNVSLARGILQRVTSWPDPRESPAADALRQALITQPQDVSPHTRERLGLLITKYLDIDPA